MRGMLSPPSIDAALGPSAGWLGPWLKGYPFDEPARPIEQIGSLGWSLFDGRLPLPLAVLRRAPLQHNLRWMQAFARRHGVQLAPHGKTTMSPELFRAQLREGAWGLSFATLQQLRVGLAAGVRRALLANTLVDGAELRALQALRRDDSQRELAFFVDSPAQLARLEQAALPGPRLDVLIELGRSRGGLRDHGAALELARRLHHHAQFRLRGIAFYEGLEASGDSAADAALVEAWAARVQRLLADGEAEGLFAGPIWLSGGGSALYDLVAPALNPQGRYLGLLRAGCYLCQDHGLYRRMGRAVAERLGDADGLRPALEVWARVLSCPEPGLAIVGAGRRDLSYDQSLPLPIWRERQGRVEAVPADWTISALNDQHAYLRWSAGTGPAVGDAVALGISHPCTTFDKWRWMPLVDEDYRVVDAISTCF